MCEKNLLLINMSTLPKPEYLRENYYTGNLTPDLNEDQSENGCYFCGVSQLEAGTKYFFRKLQTEKAKLDQIFIVESPETQSELRPISEVSQYLANDKDYMFLECEEDLSKTNAVRFFKERICQYIQGREEVKGDLEYPDLKDKIDTYENKLKSLFSSDEELKNLFDDIEIDPEINQEMDQKNKASNEQTVLFKGVQELCQKIQAFAEDGSVVNLYLYMQGGKRHEAFIINAAVNMLRMRDIKVEASVTVEFGDKKGFNNIVDSTLDDRIFEMVSGMNQFITTGRGDTLVSFHKNSKGLINLQQERMVLEEIEKISSAISICNMVSFNDSISEFKDALEKYNQKKSSNPLFRTFVKDLEDDYNKFQLLEETGSPIINRASWCLDKKLYQQALTLLEARAPEEIVTNQIIYYGCDNDLKKLINALRDRNWLKIGKDDKVSYALINHLLSCRCEDESTVTWGLNEKIDQASQKFSSTMGDPNRDFRTDEKSEEANGEKNGEPKYWNREIGELLLHYGNIRNIRNRINHSKNKANLIDSETLKKEKKIISVKLVEKNINNFIKCYKRLLGQHVKVDLSEQFSICKAARGDL